MVAECAVRRNDTCTYRKTLRQLLLDHGRQIPQRLPSPEPLCLFEHLSQKLAYSSTTILATATTETMTVVFARLLLPIRTWPLSANCFLPTPQVDLL